MYTSCPVITVSTHCWGVGHARGAKHTHTLPHVEMNTQTHTQCISARQHILGHLHIIAITCRFTKKCWAKQTLNSRFIETRASVSVGMWGSGCPCSHVFVGTLSIKGEVRIQCEDTCPVATYGSTSTRPWRCCRVKTRYESNGRFLQRLSIYNCKKLVRPCYLHLNVFRIWLQLRCNMTCTYYCGFLNMK